MTQRFMRRSGILTKATRLIAALACFPFSVSATEWSAVPSISFKEEYNDNVNLTTAPHDSVWGTRISPALKLSGKLENMEISGTAGLALNRYAGVQGADRNDQFFNLATVYKTERVNWNLDASYTRDSTLGTELATTGYVLPRKERISTNLEPSVTFVLTEKFQFTAGYQYANANYENEPTLTDYTYQKLYGELSYTLSERDQLFLVASTSQIDFSDTRYSVPLRVVGDLMGYPVYYGGGEDAISNSNSKTHEVMVGASHAFSESFTGSVRLGRNTTLSTASHTCNGVDNECTFGREYRIDDPNPTDPIIIFNSQTRSTGTSLQASLEQKFEKITFTGSLSKEVNPSGAGLVETDRFGFSVFDRFTERLDGSLRFSTYRTRYAGEVSVNQNSRYFLIEPKLSWRISEWWRMNVGYAYHKLETENSSTAATANSIYVDFVYNWPQFAVSR